jgi:hypothetical protein
MQHSAASNTPEKILAVTGFFNAKPDKRTPNTLFPVKDYKYV